MEPGLRRQLAAGRLHDTICHTVRPGRYPSQPVGFRAQFECVRPRRWRYTILRHVSGIVRRCSRCIAQFEFKYLNLSLNFRLTKKGDIHYEALLSSLKPHTAYMIRIAAINQLDTSSFTEPVVVKTQEEGNYAFSL